MSPKTNRPKPLSIEIDKLSNSIELIASGEVFDTQVVRITKAERRAILKKSWRFDWQAELELKERMVFGLVTIADPRVLQGLMCIEDRGDHVFIHLVESARFNQGKRKVYAGIPANLIAFACRESLRLGHDGVVSFVAKTKLVAHYERSLGAQVLFGNAMTIGTHEAMILITRYFKEA